MNEMTRENPRKFTRVGLVAAATIGAALVWAVAALLQLDVSVTMNGAVQAIGGARVAVSAAAVALAAWGVKALLERMLRRPTSWWLTISIAVGVLSLLGPLTMATSMAASAVLVAMHVVPAAILIPGLARTGQRKTRGTTERRQSGSGEARAEAASIGSGYGGAP